MGMYHCVLALTATAIMSLIAEPAYPRIWGNGREQGLGHGSWRIVTISGMDREQHPSDLAMNLAAQAASLAKRGNYSEAERLLKQSLEMTSQALGTDHPRIAALLIKLGSLYAVQRRYAEAERHLRLSLEINEKAFGSDHLDVAANLEALAFVLRKEQRDEETRQVQNRAFEIWSKHRNDKP